MTNPGERVRSVCVVIPTYNEAENIERIVRAVAAELDEVIPGRYRVLIVDDGSPDGTGQLADQLAAELAPVAVLHRAAKDGLGRAYLAGFAWALQCGTDLVVEMDADFSHDPSYLPDLLAASEHADVVLGSRYVDGGGVADWGFARRLISRGGGLYARWVLRLDVRDLTGGFKCIHREVLEAIDLGSVSAEGYVFQIEVTYRAHQAGFHIREVPIMFRDRTAGTSKMSARIAMEAIWLVPRLRAASAAALPGHYARDDRGLRRRRDGGDLVRVRARHRAGRPGRPGDVPDRGAGGDSGADRRVLRRRRAPATAGDRDRRVRPARP